ncbi:MAG: hypothetical protein JW955_10055 [Sedimentisphaerales bacterium]|nr:hypothetical protein [Sedimentisphaerales bacterium]
MKAARATLIAMYVVGWALPTIGDSNPVGSVGTARPAATESAIRNPQSAIEDQTVIVVIGAAGTAEYAGTFAKWAGFLEHACAKSHADFIEVGLDEREDTPDRVRLQEVLAKQPAQSSAALWLVLIGHGTFDGRAAKFNLRGPDISASDLAQWLKPMERPVAVIDTASSSAPFLKELSSPGRVIVTATKSGFEQNLTRFGRYFAEAVIDPAADLDKDGQTSLLEAFLSASHEVSEFYSAAGRLATEHALLDDNGDGLGTPAEWFRGIRPVQKARDDVSLDGYRAHQLHLLHSPAEMSMPADLRARRDQLELQVVELRDARANLSDEEYFSKLEPLLREIAHIYEQSNGQ